MFTSWLHLHYLVFTVQPLISLVFLNIFYFFQKGPKFQDKLNFRIFEFWTIWISDAYAIMPHDSLPWLFGSPQRPFRTLNSDINYVRHRIILLLILFLKTNILSWSKNNEIHLPSLCRQNFLHAYQIWWYPIQMDAGK